MSKDLSEWLQYIEQLHPSTMDLGLQRVGPLAEALRLTHFRCPVIIVGGTNGKGSVVRTLEHLYSKAGYRVAAYTSPHLLRFNERIRLNMQEVDDHSLIDAFGVIEQGRGEVSLSFFEFTTLAALYLFQQESLDVVILEVGLGGRLDAVNVIEADVAVLTTVDIDHTDWLGPDRESIGTEKSGIFRFKQSVVCGDSNPPKTVLDVVKRLECDFHCLNQNFNFELGLSSWSWESQADQFANLPLTILKCQNVATSLMVLQLLQDRLPVLKSLIYQEIGQIFLSGRFEKIQQKTVHFILDVAHNPQSTEWLAEQLSQIRAESKKILAVVGMLKDKPIQDSLAHLTPYVDEWYVAGLSNVTRGANAEQISLSLAALEAKIWYNFNTVADALEAARKTCDDSLTCILVFGSFHTVAETKEWLNNQ
jgi:dihydrofolate synthase/folylpolyglutamate synthase